MKEYSGVHAVFCEESRLGVSYTIKAGIRAVGEIYDSVKKELCPVQEAHDFVRKEHCFVKNERSFERKTEHVRTWDYLMFAVADQPNLSEQAGDSGRDILHSRRRSLCVVGKELAIPVCSGQI